MGVARKVVLEKALTINKIILHVFEEESEIKNIKKIRKQIEETKEKISKQESKEIELKVG